MSQKKKREGTPEQVQDKQPNGATVGVGRMGNRGAHTEASAGKHVPLSEDRGAAMCQQAAGSTRVGRSHSTWRGGVWYGTETPHGDRAHGCTGARQKMAMEE